MARRTITRYLIITRFGDVRLVSTPPAPRLKATEVAFKLTIDLPEPRGPIGTISLFVPDWTEPEIVVDLDPMVVGQ